MEAATHVIQKLALEKAESHNVESLLSEFFAQEELNTRIAHTVNFLGIFCESSGHSSIIGR